MKQNLAPIRPAMTAIAAVIALSSTPLLAQAADTTDAQSAPVVADGADVSAVCSTGVLIVFIAGCGAMD